MSSTFVQVGDSGQVLEIWTGWDEDKTYKLGNKLSWWPIHARPGIGIDAIYVSMNAGPAHLVAVSGGAAVEAMPVSRFEDQDDPMLAGHKYLESIWPKHNPDKSLWPEEIWAARENQKSEIKRGFRRSV